MTLITILMNYLCLCTVSSSHPFQSAALQKVIFLSLPPDIKEQFCLNSYLPTCRNKCFIFLWNQKVKQSWIAVKWLKSVAEAIVVAGTSCDTIFDLILTCSEHRDSNSVTVGLLAVRLNWCGYISYIDWDWQSTFHLNSTEFSQLLSLTMGLSLDSSNITIV